MNWSLFILDFPFYIFFAWVIATICATSDDNAAHLGPHGDLRLGLPGRRDPPDCGDGPADLHLCAVPIGGVRLAGDPGLGKPADHDDDEVGPATPH